MSPDFPERRFEKFLLARGRTSSYSENGQREAQGRERKRRRAKKEDQEHGERNAKKKNAVGGFKKTTFARLGVHGLTICKGYKRKTQGKKNRGETAGPGQGQLLRGNTSSIAKTSE